MNNSTLQNLCEWMKPLSFFKELTLAEQESLASTKKTALTFQEGETVLHQGDTDTAFFVVLDGQLSVTRNKPPEVFLAHLVPGSIFGEVTMRGDHPRTSSVTADGEVTVLKVDQSILSTIDPLIASKLKDQIIRILVKRLDEMNNKLVQFIR